MMPSFWLLWCTIIYFPSSMCDKNDESICALCGTNYSFIYSWLIAKFASNHLSYKAWIKIIMFINNKYHLYSNFLSNSLTNENVLKSKITLIEMSFHNWREKVVFRINKFRSSGFIFYIMIVKVVFWMQSSTRKMSANNGKINRLLRALPVRHGTMFIDQHLGVVEENTETTRNKEEPCKIC